MANKNYSEFENTRAMNRIGATVSLVIVALLASTADAKAAYASDGKLFSI